MRVVKLNFVRKKKYFLNIKVPHGALYDRRGTGISCKEKNREENFQICVYLSFFIITKLFLKSESLLLFKLNYLIVPIGKKPAPATTNPVWKFSLQDVPVSVLCRMTFGDILHFMKKLCLNNISNFKSFNKIIF